MSALGHKQTCAVHQPMSALPPIATEIADSRSSRYLLYPAKAGMCVANNDVRFGPKADRRSSITAASAPQRDERRDANASDQGGT